MKALVYLLILPSLLLVGCGKLETKETTSGNAINQLEANGALTEEEAQSVNADLLDENLQVSEVSSRSMLMKVGGVDLLIDFFDNLSGDPQDTAMQINGIPVTAQVASDPQSMQGLIASIVTSHLDGKEIFGVPLSELVTTGLGIINGDKDKADFSNLFGTIIRGALNMFKNSSPIGQIVGTIVGGLLDDKLGGGDPNNTSNNLNNNNNSSGGFLGGFLDNLGGSNSGGSSGSSLGGIFSLIMNLFK